MKRYFFLFLLFFSSLKGDHISVTNLLDAGVGSLRAAISSAVDGDIIEFDPLLDGTILLLSDLPSITVNVEIIGPSSKDVSISGNTLFSCFDVGMNLKVTIENLSIVSGAKTGSGAGLNVGSNAMVTVSNCDFIGCTATGSGAGMSLGSSSQVFMSNCSFTTCSAVGNQGGAVHLSDDAVLHLIDTTFSNNSSGGFGDDLYLTATSAINFVSSTNTATPTDIFGTGTLLKNGEGSTSFSVGSSCPLTYLILGGELIGSGTRTGPTITFDRFVGSQTTQYIANHGIVKPSETIGTMVCSEDYYQDEQAILEIEIAPFSTDLLQVQGNAVLEGTLAIFPQNSAYSVGDIFTFLTATGMVEGTFTTLTSTSLGFQVIYEQHQVSIQITSL